MTTEKRGRGRPRKKPPRAPVILPDPATIGLILAPRLEDRDSTDALGNGADLCRAARRASRMTQPEFAELIGIDVRSLRRWEAGGELLMPIRLLLDLIVRRWRQVEKTLVGLRDLRLARSGKVSICYVPAAEKPPKKRLHGRAKRQAEMRARRRAERGDMPWLHLFTTPPPTPEHANPDWDCEPKPPLRRPYEKETG